MDKTTKIQQLKDLVEEMVVERDWQQFHSLKNLAIDISVEASELLEHFLWCDSKDSANVFEKKQQDIEDELADIIIAVLAFSNRSSIDIATVVERKLQEVKRKYPVALARGKSEKYTHYQKSDLQE